LGKDLIRRCERRKLDEVEGGGEEGGCTANEGLARIQYQCLVPIYVFPEMKLHECYFQNRIIMFCLPISTFMYL
jgi:hypothetical protein